MRVGGVPAGEKLTGGGSVLAVDPIGNLHLIWNGRRFALTDPGLVLDAFLWPRSSATLVSPALLNAVPAGPDLGRVNAPRSEKA